MMARAERFLWLCLLLFVPVSSSPALPFGSGTLARPLAIVPAALLLLLALFRMTILGQRPRLDGRGFRLLAVFTLYTVIAGLLVVSKQADDAFKGQTPVESLVRALLTWVAGLAFYLTARLQIRTAEDIRITLRFLFIGMSASIALAGLQVVAMVQHGELLRLVQAITDLFAVHYDGLISRAQGMTFEPSWLATQIIVLLMPALLARALSRQEGSGIPAGPRFAVRLTGGLVVAVSGMLFSGSRLGLACMIAMLMLGGFLAALRGRLLVAGLFFALLLGGGGGLAILSGFGSGAGASYVIDPIAAAIGSGDLGAAAAADPTSAVTDALVLAGRVAAGEAAALTWIDHPLFGVSLGNNYRYFTLYAPDWAFATQLFQGNKEGVGWLDPNSPEKGNAKNMILRLLSETGIVGFALFAAFLFRQIFQGPPRDAYHRYFRLMSALALGFSFLNQDSFVDAGLWIPLALCFAMNEGNRQAVPTV